ncbi:AAA+ ATPase domain [Arabidopsis thaliana x Arabidopsis arenosa]|uniref:AAA+ ATPase domain n=1 Tax=Arabidopsis thaliana x Arabidopsis arenosa TaxID=1240361 RepID=A0A8T1YUA2_9BRAS|nr:AAA+ ATPase domain [Arabidopsis thaliana x Arabidopsis arenosa]
MAHLRIPHLTTDLDKDTTTYSYGPNSFKLFGIPAPRPGELLGLLGTHSIGKSTALKLLAGVLKPNLGRVHRLSGQVLQRVMIAAVFLQKADVYIFDEPSSLLDVRQKFKAAQVIRSLLTLDSYVIVADNDISLLDYLSDAIYCLYGKPEAHGILSPDYCVRSGIEVFLAGFDHTRNLRIRDESLIFEVARTPPPQIEWKRQFFSRYKYPNMRITLGDFKLEVMEGEFTDCQVSVVLGESCSGKTTFLQLLGDMVPPDYVEGLQLWKPKFPVSYKPQIIGWRGECTVRQMPELSLHLEDMHPAFVRDVMKPLQIEQLLDRKVESLSPGETQRVALTICLGSPASVYLIDEPGAYLNSELRINAAMAIRRHVLRMRKAAIVVEHDLTMATYMADQVIVVDGNVPTNCTTNPPYPLVSGMNRFLPHLDITFRRNRMSLTHTPRVNKLGSIEDTRQKDAGNYYDVV